MTMITLYQQHDSGNCYKVRLVLTHLDRPFRTVAVSSFDGSTRRPDFLAKNPIGKVPAVQLGDGRFLAESNAILLYFGEGTALFPDDAYDRAKAYEWLFFEQYSHEPAIAVRRALSVYPERPRRRDPRTHGASPGGRQPGAGGHGAAARRCRLACRQCILARRHLALCLHPHGG
jgi:glutathione S-transferase